MADYKLKADGTAQLDVQMGNKVKHLVFDYTERPMLAATIIHCPVCDGSHTGHHLCEDPFEKEAEGVNDYGVDDHSDVNGVSFVDPNFSPIRMDAVSGTTVTVHKFSFEAAAEAVDYEDAESRMWHAKRAAREAQVKADAGYLPYVDYCPVCGLFYATYGEPKSVTCNSCGAPRKQV